VLEERGQFSRKEKEDRRDRERGSPAWEKGRKNRRVHFLRNGLPRNGAIKRPNWGGK